MAGRLRSIPSTTIARCFAGIPAPTDKRVDDENGAGAAGEMAALYRSPGEWNRAFHPEATSRATIQTTSSKSFMVAEHLYSIRPALRCGFISDIFATPLTNMPKFQLDSSSRPLFTCRNREATATLGARPTRLPTALNISVFRHPLPGSRRRQVFAPPPLSFFWRSANETISWKWAKMRGWAGLIWAKLVKQFFQSQRAIVAFLCPAPLRRPPAGRSPAQDVPNNNAIRHLPLKPMAAARPDAVHCTPPRFDESPSPCRPTSAARIILATPKSSCSKEAGVCRTIDPWGGSLPMSRRLTLRPRESRLAANIEGKSVRHGRNGLKADRGKASKLAPIEEQPPRRIRAAHRHQASRPSWAVNKSG